MKRTMLALCLLLLASPMMAAAAEEGQFFKPRANVIEANGEALTPPSRAAHHEITVGFLKSRGRSAGAVQALEEVTANRMERVGITHHRFEQRVDGLPVYGAYSKIAIDDQGRIVHAIDQLAEVRGELVPAGIRDRQALVVTLQHLFGDERPEMHGTPTATRVAVPMADGTLAEGFLVETWTEKDNLLHHTLVSGAGEILNVELRTALDTYNIFPDHPGVTAQTTVNGPGSGNTESPIGWLGSSGHTSISISGNNTHSYLDADNNNAADAGGTSITNGSFVTAADLNASPSTSTNRAVAIQNLFYLNNVIHDKLYRHGFNEAAGNFQENNFGKGGAGSDSVNAEGQDGGGTDNANFSTPTDGSNPRMQMYLWSGLGDHLVTVGSSTYLAMGAEFGPALNTTGVSGAIAYAGDGCTTISIGLVGKIALIDRGTCDFVTKVKNAQAANASGVIVANNAGDDIISMGGTDSTITIPSVFVGQTDGQTIRNAATTTKISANPNPPLMRDGDLDSDIVYHEYGHGLTWRMIGSMSGAMPGAIGEGMSDVLALLMNDRDTVGSYSASNTNGIRRYPYTNYPLTYGDFAGASVHNDGEIYAAAVWKVWQIFQSNGVPKDTLWNYLIGGMNYTPAGPTMDQMRDGILQASPSSVHDCLIWQGFAAYGIGEGARVRVRGPNYTVTESFVVPSSCSGGTTNVPPTASFTFSASNLTVTFTDASSDSDGTIASRSWNFGDGNTSTATSPMHTYAAAGTYSVTLTVTDDDGATNSNTQSVSVTTSTSNAAPTASFSVSTSGLTATFTDASSDSDGTIASRSWSFGDGNTSTATNPTHTYATGGTYTVTLTVTDNGGATGSTSQNVSVTEPTTGITLTATGYKVKGVQHADLSWTGTTGSVTILRNGAAIATVSGSSYIDNIGQKGGGSYTYQVCESGTCSNTVQVTF